MIKQTKVSLLVTEILIWIFTGFFWHGVYECSLVGIIACISALTNLVWIIVYMPQSRLDIRSAFDGYSLMYLICFGTISFITGLSSLLQELHAMKFIEEIEINLSLTPSSSHLHISLVCAKIIEYVYWKIKKYYMTRNVNDETQNQNAIIYDDGVCAICLGPHENASRPHCGHTFCFSCLWSWCRINLTCPICKRPITAITSEHTPKCENVAADLRFDSPLFNFNVDQTLLREEICEIVGNVIVFGLKFLIAWTFSKVHVGFTKMAWICNQAISQ